MTYLHDYLEARRKVREVSERVMLAIVGELHPAEFECFREGRPTSTFPGEHVGPDSVRVRLDGMPDGYILEVSIYPLKEVKQ